MSQLRSRNTAETPKVTSPPSPKNEPYTTLFSLCLFYCNTHRRGLHRRNLRAAPRLAAGAEAQKLGAVPRTRAAALFKRQAALRGELLQRLAGGRARRLQVLRIRRRWVEERGEGRPTQSLDATRQAPSPTREAIIIMKLMLGVHTLNTCRKSSVALCLPLPLLGLQRPAAARSWSRRQTPTLLPPSVE